MEEDSSELDDDEVRKEVKLSWRITSVFSAKLTVRPDEDDDADIDDDPDIDDDDDGGENNASENSDDNVDGNDDLMSDEEKRVS